MWLYFLHYTTNFTNSSINISLPDMFAYGDLTRSRPNGSTEPHFSADVSISINWDQIRGF